VEVGGPISNRTEGGVSDFFLRKSLGSRRSKKEALGFTGRIDVENENGEEKAFPYRGGEVLYTYRGNIVKDGKAQKMNLLTMQGMRTSGQSGEPKKPTVQPSMGERKTRTKTRSPEGFEKDIMRIPKESEDYAVTGGENEFGE